MPPLATFGGGGDGREAGCGPSRTKGATHRARLEVEADEQHDLGHQDGTGQVGVDVVALVPDGADRAGGREAGVRPPGRA